MFGNLNTHMFQKESTFLQEGGWVGIQISLVFNFLCDLQPNIRIFSQFWKS